MATFLDSHPDDATTTYTQPTATPTAKVKAVGFAGIGSTVIIFILNMFGVQIDEVTAAAIVTVIVFIAGYFKKSDTANGAVKKV